MSYDRSEFLRVRPQQKAPRRQQRMAKLIVDGLEVIDVDQVDATDSRLRKARETSAFRCDSNAARVGRS